MFKSLTISKASAAAAAFIFSVAFADVAQANVLVNGDFTKVGPNGSLVCMTGSGAAWSAGANWAQWAVVPGSYICTEMEPGFIPRLHVWTNGGDWPPTHMGNGFGQSFSPLTCATASYWYNVTSGQIIGNLVRSDTGALIGLNAVLKPTNNAWKQFKSFWNQGAEALYFETLTPVGIIPRADYRIAVTDVEPCRVVPPTKDLSNYVTCAQPGCPPITLSTDPEDPWETIRVTNTSNGTIEGPIHVFIDGLPSGRAVANPDGSYLDRPYVNLISPSLEPGQSENVTIHFDGSASSVPSFRVQINGGDF